MLYLSGCLAGSYAIAGDEVRRIAALPPENRGTHVRATQQTSFADAYNAPEPVAAEPAGPNVTGVVILGGPVPPAHHHHHHPTGNAGVGAVLAGSHRQPAQPRSGGSHVGGSGFGNVSKAAPSKGNDASTAATIAVAALVVGTSAFSIAALTEGPRFDGWVWIPPTQQLMLKPRGANPYWLPLSELTREDAALVESAVLMQDAEQRLERAPLHRVGLSTSLELGGSAMRSSNATTNGGFAARYGLGGFPLPWLGILGNAGFSVGDDNGTLFDGRLGLELRLMPLHLRRVHLGGYGELGHAWLLHDRTGGSAHGEGAYFGLGGLLEIDLTTRLGLLLRGGAAWLPNYASAPRNSVDRHAFPEFTIGLAVY